MGGWRFVRRDVPVTLCLQALFGGLLIQFGWFFLAFGSLAFWGMIIRCEAFTNWKFAGELATAHGAVTRVTDTGKSEGGGEGERGTPIYRIDYIFLPRGATAPQAGRSYQLGTWPERNPGAAVTVEYRPNHPAWSRIQGLRSAEFTPVVLIALVFPLFGLTVAVIGVYKGTRAITLMRYGRPAAGTLVRVEPTNMEINENKVYRITFAFTAGRGERREASLTTAEPKPAWMAFHRNPDSAPTAELQAAILYHPANPASAFVPMQFGDRVRVDERGYLHGADANTGFALGILPVLTMAGNLLALFHYLAAG